MTKQEKFEALYTVIRAYLSRGKYIQYDQRCMDRKLFLTPRRIKLIPPEAATSQKTVFLDCSSYVGAVYYEAFGYELPADLTWHMIDYVAPRVFYYEFTHTEIKEELEALKKSFTEALEPGDVMTYDRGVGSGHTMIYVGDGMFTHCTSGVGNPDSYDYVNKKSREYDCGGLWLESLDALFNERRLFNPNVRRVAIARPLDLPLEITENTAARIAEAADLWLGIESTPHGTQTVAAGETIEYTLTVKNLEKECKKITGTFTAPDKSTLLTNGNISATLEANATLKLTFSVRVDSVDNALLDAPKVTVNGLSVFSPRILLGKKLDDGILAKICTELKERILSGEDVLEAANAAYGVSLPKTEREILCKYFYLHDSTSGDILTRRAQNPHRDMSVYSLFGGIGVSTPEMISYPDIRITKICKENFTNGDIIICTDDPYGNLAYSCCYTGGTLVGSFEPGGKKCVITGADVDSFLDSLLGRFCFIVIRPSLI